jgi:hypothetical protein
MRHRLNRAGPPPRSRRLMLLAFAVPLLAIPFVRSAVSRNDGGHEDNAVVYEVRQVGTHTEITYSLPYLDKVSRGESVSGADDAAIVAPIPTYSVKMPDGFPTNIVFDVKESRPDDRPVILVSGIRATGARLVFRNQGWSSTQDTNLTILGWAKVNQSGPPCIGAPYSRTSSAPLELGPIETEVVVDLSPVIPKSFSGDASLCLLGKLQYAWGSANKAELNFATEVSLEERAPPPAPQEQAIELYDVPLPCRIAGYEVTAGILLSDVKSADSKHMMIKVWPDRTCDLVMDVSLIMADQTRIAIGTLAASIFVPRYREPPVDLATVAQIPVGQSVEYVKKLRKGYEDTFR